MGYIARILTKMKIEPKYELILATNDKDKGSDLPTIIVGRDLAQELICSEEFIDPVDRVISDKLRWTYSDIENRSLYERDMENFYETLIKSTEKEVPYCFYSIFRNSLHNTKKVLRFVKEDKSKKYLYLEKDMLYLYTPRGGNRKVIGFSLNECGFCGIDRSKILKHICQGRDVSLLSEKKNGFNKLLTVAKKDNYRHIIPYLFYKQCS